MLYFYPKDFTLGCTAEAKTFGARRGEIEELDAEVLAISSDSVESHGRFAMECDVGFRMLSDLGGRVRKTYGAESLFGLIPGRVTFVIDKKGVVRRVFSSQTEPKRHASEAIEALRGLQG